MFTPRAILVLLAFVCFFLAAMDVPVPRVKLEPLGLALAALAYLVG